MSGKKKAGEMADADGCFPVVLGIIGVLGVIAAWQSNSMAGLVVAMVCFSLAAAIS